MSSKSLKSMLRLRQLLFLDGVISLYNNKYSLLLTKVVFKSK